MLCLYIYIYISVNPSRPVKYSNMCCILKGIKVKMILNQFDFDFSLSHDYGNKSEIILT